MKALLITDIQNDFLPGGSLAVKEGDLIVPTINDLASQYELVVATQDWHPIDHKSFVSQHIGKKVFDTIDLNGLPQTLWPEHCVQDSWGAQFPASLSLKPIAVIFHKGMNASIDSYSGFYDNAKLSNTGLDGYLKAKGITAVDICGLAADYCVYYTAMDALELGFQST
ncbi:MAG: bifunctional nicotinamidase/pyrazinamidase, partial [Pseudopedobacter saltans]